MFGPMKSRKVRDMTDGASNTAMIGETSNFILNASNGSKTANVQGIHGLMMGTPNHIDLDNCNGCSLDRQFNQTTVRYPPNFPAIVNSTPGMGDNYGINKPLNSAHTGGVHILLGDGAVRFISDNIFMQTLAQLCTRDDNLPMGEF